MTYIVSEAFLSLYGIACLLYGFSITFVYFMSNLYIRWDLYHIFSCICLYVLYFYDLFHILLSFWLTSRAMECIFICTYGCNAQLCSWGWAVSSVESFPTVQQMLQLPWSGWLWRH